MKSGSRKSPITPVSPSPPFLDNALHLQQPSYPLPAYLNFVPGGVDYGTVPPPAVAVSNAGCTEESHHPSQSSSSTQQQQDHWYLLNLMGSPDGLVKRAHAADLLLRKYALHYEASFPAGLPPCGSSDGAVDGFEGKGPPGLSHRLPSLSVLAEAAFAPLTGLQAPSVRKWADTMVLAYLNDDDDEENADGTDAADAKPKPFNKDTELLSEYHTLLSQLHTSSHVHFKFPPSTTPQSPPTPIRDLPALLSQLHQSHLQQTSPPTPHDPTSPSKLPPTQRAPPIRPCGYVFRRGDIAWNCRTCQTDSTCVLCDDCFRGSDHTGHEVFFHRTNVGGCCDCGDVEAWSVEGCCERHRPVVEECIPCPVSGGVAVAQEDGVGIDATTPHHEGGIDLTTPISNNNPNNENTIDYEAVKASLRGRRDGTQSIQDMLPPRFSAALGIVIGAAVNAVLRAVDGSGIASDRVQWTRRWADQLRRIYDGRSLEEEYASSRGRGCVGSVGEASKLDFPGGFRLQLRLHNDDVHTFDEVISALYERRKSYIGMGSGSLGSVSNRVGEEDGLGGGSGNGDSGSASNTGSTSAAHASETDVQFGVIPSRENASELTHHVDSDGQVVVRSYMTLDGAKAGYDRLKSKGLQCAVVSTPQVDLELRARLLLSWLADISAAHPAVSALVVHALVDVTEGTDPLGGVHVWGCARMLPPWSFSPGCLSTNFDGGVGGGDMDCGGAEQEEGYLPGWRRRMDVFAPNLDSSYLTREEAMQLHQLGFTAPDDPSSPIVSPAEFAELRGADANFYSKVPYLLPGERYRKSPHALWGTMPPPFATGKKCEHPILYRQSGGDRNSYNLLDRLLVLDTDLRKQQEADILTSNKYPHKLLGLHMISGVGLFDVEEDENGGSLMAPTADDWRLLLSVSSYRAPVSPILLFLLLDPYPPKQLRVNVHSLFLSLIVDPRFKSRFAASLGAVAYRPLSTLFCSGVGTEADTPLGFTVQTFTVGSLVRALGNADATRQLLDYDGPKKEEGNVGFQDVFTLPLAHNIVRCIHTNLLGATKEVTMILKNTAAGNRSIDEGKFDNGGSRGSTLPALTYQHGELPLTTLLPAAPDDGFLESRSMKHKRLPHLLRDLEYVFETPGTALRILLSPPSLSMEYKNSALGNAQGSDPTAILSFPAIWCRLLRLAQGMDPQKRKTSGGHVEYEAQRWLEAFSLTLNFSGARDALAESQTHSIPNNEPPNLETVREGMGNLFVALVREMKWWLYKEGVWETGFPLSAARGASDALGATGQMEALQRSTLHVSSPSPAATSSPDDGVPPIALSCATHVKMTESHLVAIENALRAEQAVERNTAGRGTIMGDWLRVPHSPHGGACLSFHLPLHRSFARNIRSVCTMVVPESVRDAQPKNWWQLPILDVDASDLHNVADDAILEHPLSTILRPALRTSNCRITWSSGPDCNSEEAQMRRSRSRAISAAIASAKVIHSMCDHPLRCLAAAEQITRHLWARNGQSAAGMALNYSTAPLCRDFRDLDLTMVQLSASGLSIGLGARRVFSLLLSRFNLDGHLCDPEKRRGHGSPSSASTNSFGGTGWIKPQRLQDPDHAIPLAEALFSTICVLVTELPPPPPVAIADDSGLRMHVRRELLHSLSAKPRSYSEAMSSSAAAFTRRDESESNTTGKSGGTASLRNLFSDVLQDIAKQKTQGARSTEAPTFELRPEVSDEYDPTFFHLRRPQHQHAMDNIARLRKQKISGNSKNDRNLNTKCLPIVGAPPCAHPRFIPCRLILHLPAFDASIRRALLLALTGGQWFPPQEPSDFNDTESGSASFSSEHCVPKGSVSKVGGLSRRNFNRDPSGLKKSTSMVGKTSKFIFTPEVVNASSVSFLEVLQLLTLQVHTLEECAFLHRSHPSLDHENRSISAGLSINSYLSRLIHVPHSLVDEWALRATPDGPLPSLGSGLARGSILGFLIALFEHRADNEINSGSDTVHGEDGHGGARFLVANGLKWLLRFVQCLVDGAQSVKEACASASNGTLVKKSDDHGNAGSALWTIDPALKTDISSMLQNLRDLWPKHDADTQANDSAGLTAKSREARKAAQMRVMQKMKAQQAKFAATVTTGGKGAYDGGKGSVDEESDLCIICRCDDDDGENNGPLGYLGHIQRSRTLQLRSQFECLCREDKLSMTYRVTGDKGCQVRETEAMDSDPVACISAGNLVQVVDPTVSDEYDLLSRRVFIRHESPEDGQVVEGWASVQSTQGYVILSPLVNLCQTNSRWGCTRPIIRQCGHAAHLACVETHVASIHQKAQTESPFDGRFAADIDDGEFLCPLCKQLCNVVVPAEKYEKESSNNLRPARNMKSPKQNSSMLSPQLKSLQDTLTSWPHPVATDKAKKKAIEQYGTYLYHAMQVFSWDQRHGKKKKKNKWHAELNNWDFEQDKDENCHEKFSASSNNTSVGDILRLLRKQHIAWAAAGHSAATAEASSRGVRRLGFDPPTSDPWADYHTKSRDSHLMLLELRRTLTAASSLYSVLCNDMSKTFHGDGSIATGDNPIANARSRLSQHSFSLVGHLLNDIMGGDFWSHGGKHIQHSTEHIAKATQWSVLSALLSSTPCHVSRDETLSARLEARATAAAIWVVKGFEPLITNEKFDVPSPKQRKEHSEKSTPPLPLSVRQISSAEDVLQKPWGTLDPLKALETVPFRPALACAFLYIPLLLWDLNSLAGAVFSTILSSKDRNSEDLLLATRMLLVGRMVQVLITPGGFDSKCTMTLDAMDTEFDIELEGTGMASLLHHCQSTIKKDSKPATQVSGEDGKVLTAVSFAILPFARTLILILRASMSALRQNAGRNHGNDNVSSTDDLLHNLLESDEAMYMEDGFYFMHKLGAPMPSTIANSLIGKGDVSWATLINKWLNAVTTLESYHGSHGRHLQFDADSKEWIQSVPPAKVNDRLNRRGENEHDIAIATSASEDAVPMDFSAGGAAYNEENFGDEESATEHVEGVDDDSMGEGASSDETDELHQINAMLGVNDIDFHDEDMEDDDAEVDMDDDDIGAIPLLPSQRSHIDNEETADSDEGSDTNASVRSCDREKESAVNDRLFANLSCSAIIPYQPSFLGSSTPGPGPRGRSFDYISASSVMRDLSHLGMVHSSANFQGSGLIRLPRSFVELYGIVNQVKTNGKTNSLDDGDDNGGGEAAICLITGTIMRSGSPRRAQGRSRNRVPGSCTLHARMAGSGTGIFFLVQKCTVLLVHNKKSAYSASLYVDEHGEEDTSLRRGRPLFLKDERYEALESLWRQHGIPREVAQIRSTSDRVIRENWY